MRKIITCSAIFLLFTLLSGMAFAGTYPECDEFKQAQVKGLFGLCVAYQNADADGKEDIFSHWLKRVGDGEPRLPGAPYPDDPPPPTGGADFACPCWSQLEFTEICDLGTPILNEITYVNGLPVEGSVDFIDPDLGTPDVFSTDGTECVHVFFDPAIGDSGGTFVYDIQSLVVDEDLMINEPADCRAEIEMIGNLHQESICQTP